MALAGSTFLSYWPTSGVSAPLRTPPSDSHRLRTAANAGQACPTSVVGVAAAGTFAAVVLHQRRKSSLRSLRRAVDDEEVPDAGRSRDDKEKVLWFGGVHESLSDDEWADQVTPAMQTAFRINRALAARRSPLPEEPPKVLQTAWYDELGIAPTATQEELTLSYLQMSARVERRLSRLLDVNKEVLEEAETLALEGREEEARALLTDVQLEEGMEEEAPFFDERGEQQGREGMWELAERAEEDPDGATEAEQIALAFRRASNLYQILSVPRLRKLYDEGGPELLAQRVPMLHKALLEPEKAVIMAKGLSLASTFQQPTSLLLHREPKVDNWFKHQSMNSIRRVLRRMVDVFRVKRFLYPWQLKEREGSVFTELPEVAIMGRVNSGKSSLIQHLFQSANLKRNGCASVAKRPGKTEGVDVFCINKRFTIADTPGWATTTRHWISGQIQQAWQSHWGPLMKEYLDTTPWLRGVIYCQDISKEVAPEDLHMLEELRSREIPVLLVFTKDDKVDSDEHRQSRVRHLRQELGWPAHLPHAHYQSWRGGYGQVFKNLLGTMFLGMASAADREEVHRVMAEEFPQIFQDYRDKYVPKKRGQFGKLSKVRKVRTYPYEDKVMTDKDLEQEQKAIEAYEKAEMIKERKEQRRREGRPYTFEDEVEMEAGEFVPPEERLRRWKRRLEQEEMKEGRPELEEQRL